MTTQQQMNNQAYGLITHFVSCYKARFKVEPVVNRYRSKYGLIDMIKDLGYDRSKEVITFYFEGQRNKYTISDLLAKYDSLSTLAQEIAEDEVERQKIRAETKQRVEEWEKLHGKSRTSSN